MEYNKIDQSDFIESAAYLADRHNITYGNGTCTAPCSSCGGGCYGCKGSKMSERTSTSLEGNGSRLVEMVESVL